MPVVTEIPQGSAIYLTGHGDQDINQAETGADPFIFKFTKGYIPKTRTAQDEPLSAIVLGHLESVPGWMLKEAAVVGQLVVMQQDTGVQLSKELVVVAHESNLTKEQIEDLMTDAAASLETLKVHNVHIRLMFNVQVLNTFLLVWLDDSQSMNWG